MISRTINLRIRFSPASIGHKVCLKITKLCQVSLSLMMRKLNHNQKTALRINNPEQAPHFYSQATIEKQESYLSSKM